MIHERDRPATLPAQYLPFENGESGFNRFDELRQRWDNRLTVNNLALAKRYIESKLKVLSNCPGRARQIIPAAGFRSGCLGVRRVFGGCPSPVFLSSRGASG